MQVKVKYYNPKVHDKYRALRIGQQRAADMFNALRVEGTAVLILPFKTDYRGEVMICARGETTIHTYGLAELTDVGASDCAWVWHFRYGRRVVEMPVTGGEGLFTLVVPKGDITVYPTVLILGVENLL